MMTGVYVINGSALITGDIGIRIMVRLSCCNALAPGIHRDMMTGVYIFNGSALIIGDTGVCIMA